MMPSNLYEIGKVFLDSAPIIYKVEKHEKYYSVVNPLFSRIDNKESRAVISPITISECLVIPLRTRNETLINTFTKLFRQNKAFEFHTFDQQTAIFASNLRAQHNILLLDAYQLAIAIQSQCDAFLTNDKKLKRVQEINVLLVDDLLEDWNT